MRDKAALACRALCRGRVAEKLQRRRGTLIGEHLKLVLSSISRSVEPWFPPPLEHAGVARFSAWNKLPVP